MNWGYRIQDFIELFEFQVVQMIQICSFLIYGCALERSAARINGGGSGPGSPVGPVGARATGQSPGPAGNPILSP